MSALELDTPCGVARVHLHPVDGARAALVLGHGAGGGVQAPDLLAARRVANEAGVSVALVEQPYRVLGRRSPPRAPILDGAWVSVVEQLRVGSLRELPIITGGRSSGARVACRTAGMTDSSAVLCLAFPLTAPSGASRQEELDAVDASVLVIQGASDRFGRPEPTERRTVVVVRGDHGLKSDMPALEDAIASWLMVVVARVG